MVEAQACGGLVIDCCLTLFPFSSPQSSPVWLSSIANERTPPIELHATSPYPLSLSSCSTTNVTLPSQDALFLVNPPPTSSTTTSAFSHFFPISCQCFITHCDPLISAPFLPPPPSSDPFAARRSKVGQVSIASPVPRFYPSTPALPELQKEDSSDFFFCLRDAKL